MNKPKVVPLRIPEGLDTLAALRAREEHTDKATALRQWLHNGAELYALKLVSEGRISIGYAAEVLDLSIYDMHRLAEANGIEIGATLEQSEQSLELVRRLLQSDEPTAKRRRSPAG
jgi:hypothetical protein